MIIIAKPPLFARLFGRRIIACDFAYGVETAVTAIHWRGKVWVTNIKRKPTKAERIKVALR